MPATEPETILHATTIAVGPRAALIRGAAGSGKSGLALQLMALGARLIADDQTRIWRADGDVIADVPGPIRGRIEARNVGILAAPAAGACPLALIVDMDHTETERLPPLRRETLLDIGLPVVRKTDFAHFPAAILLYLTHGRLE